MCQCYGNAIGPGSRFLTVFHDLENGETDKSVHNARVLVYEGSMNRSGPATSTISTITLLLHGLYILHLENRWRIATHPNTHLQLPRVKLNNDVAQHTYSYSHSNFQLQIHHQSSHTTKHHSLDKAQWFLSRMIRMRIHA